MFPRAGEQRCAPLESAAEELLTLGALPRTSRLMLSSRINFYAQWRRRGVVELREDPAHPSERLLQAVWFHQRILREKLQTTDGRAIQILHPGFWNREAGPDFRGALLRIGDDSPVEGDIEVDLRSAGWRDHGHATNPNFKNVRLHVVWDRDEPGAIPTVVLKDLLDAPVSELATWLGSDWVDHFPESLRGHCCAPLREIGPERRQQLLQQAGLVRLQSKAAQFRSRARQHGSEQALWEGLLRALGYKNNVWPMQRLGELRDRIAKPKAALLETQARLMGVAGLLPQEMARGQKAVAGTCAAALGLLVARTVRFLMIAFCREQPGALTTCVRRIIRNGAWRWLRTGLSIRRCLPESSVGARRKFLRRNCSIPW